MVVITAGRTSDIEYDVKALFSELAIHCFLYKVLSLKVLTPPQSSQIDFLQQPI